MHRLTLDLVLASERTPQQFANFQKHIPGEWILEALAATGTATVRHRRLPAEQVVWLVIGIAMMRDLSIVQVVDRLNLALPGKGPVAPSAVSQARSRVGAAPLEWLFVTTAEAWAHASTRGAGSRCTASTGRVNAWRTATKTVRISAAPMGTVVRAATRCCASSR